jgi:hypothetical protein
VARALWPETVLAGLAAVLLSVQPASACHRFKYWAYPFPQKCGVRASPVRTAALPHRRTLPAEPPSLSPIPDLTAVWETTVPQDLLDGVQRKAAILRLTRNWGKL